MTSNTAKKVVKRMTDEMAISTMALSASLRATFCARSLSLPRNVFKFNPIIAVHLCFVRSFVRIVTAGRISAKPGR